MMHNDDICYKLLNIESYINNIDKEHGRMQAENKILREKLQASIRENRILSHKVSVTSKRVRSLIRKLKEGLK